MDLSYEYQKIKHCLEQNMENTQKTLDTSSKFLRKFQYEFNEYLGKSESVKIYIQNSKYIFNDKLPILFDIILFIALREREYDFPIHARAANSGQEIFTIHISGLPIATLEPYKYDMSGGMNKNNIKLFGDISEAFCSLFAPSGEVKLNI